MQIFLWGPKKCQKDDSFYVEGVLSDYVNDFC